MTIIISITISIIISVTLVGCRGRACSQALGETATQLLARTISECLGSCHFSGSRRVCPQRLGDSFSTFGNMLKLTISPQAKSAETDPPGHTYA